MINSVSNETIIFQEDAQTFYVDQEAVDYSGYSTSMCGLEGGLACGGYTAAMIGMPDWGIIHATNRFRDTSRWFTRYRTAETARNWSGFLLTAIMCRLLSVFFINRKKI